MPDYGHYILAPYACHDDQAGGRLHKENSSPGRSDFQRDCDRITHSDAYRRLRGKTQVFVYVDKGDHYRDRGSHTSEVAQLAEGVARQLGLNPDLAKAVAMAHDLGHPPFGHAGETTLCRMMEPYGGFDHNAHSIDIVTRIEAKYADFDGLNLSWATLEGIAKHNGPVTNPPRALRAYNKRHDLLLGTYASAEAQVASFCDDIAYNSHDIQDGLRARILTVDSLMNLPLVGEIFDGVMSAHPKIEMGRLIHEAKRRMINIMVQDLVTQTMHNIEEAGVRSVDEIRSLGKPVAQFSPGMQENIDAIRQFLRTHMYRHERVVTRLGESQEKIEALFNALLNNPAQLPDDWKARADGPRGQRTAETVCDYIAGMTDQYAYLQYDKLVGTQRTRN